MNNDINEQLEGQETWKIQDDSTADWFIETKQQELKEIARYKEQLEAKILTYNNKLDKLKTEETYVKDNMNSKLAEYFDTLNEKDMKKTKTMMKYRLPSGELVKKYPAPKIIRDEDTLVKWLEDNKLLDLVTISKKANWGELKKTVTITDTGIVVTDAGEVVEGVKAEERPPVFEVKI